MKKITVLLICVLFMHVASAQWSNKWLSHTDHKHLLYTHGDVMVGNKSGGNLGLSFVFNSKYSVEIGYSASSNQALSNFTSVLKSANKSESAEIIASPDEMLENYHMMMGRHFNLNTKGTFRLVVQGGPGMSVVNTKSAVTKSSGYTVIPTVRTSDFSVMVNSKIEFPINRVIGFSAGPTLLMNHDRKYFSMGVGFIYGIISRN
jgi:hypothetical protein